MRLPCLAVLLVLAASIRAEGPADNAEGLPSKDQLRVMTQANAVYVFPHRSLAPTVRDDKHLRLLDAEARAKLMSILGDKRNWYYGLMTIAEVPDVPSIGILFRSGGDEFTLFFNEITIEAIFHGQRDNGMLEPEPMKKFDDWKQHYASTELHLK
jgi:hypothetical protein